MHYYKKNIGDYHKKAGRLSMLQHGAYTLLIDACYDREKFPTLDQAIDWVWASSPDEISAITFVLNKFFTEENGVFIQSRIEEEVSKYHANSATNKRIAQERETKRRENSTKRAPTVNEPPPNQEPLTKNQELLTNKDSSPIGSINKVDNCPHESIAKLYMEILPELPRVAKLTDKRKKSLGAAWRSDIKCQTLEFWEGYFQTISQSNFLMGRSSSWMADFDFVINQNKMIKIIEGAYE